MASEDLKKEIRSALDNATLDELLGISVKHIPLEEKNHMMVLTLKQQDRRLQK